MFTSAIFVPNKRVSCVHSRLETRTMFAAAHQSVLRLTVGTLSNDTFCRPHWRFRQLSKCCMHTAHHNGRAVWDKGLHLLACWDCGFESSRMCLLWMLCVIRQRSLRRADHSSRGVLPAVVCHWVCNLETSMNRRPWPALGCCMKKGSAHTNLILINPYLHFLRLEIPRVMWRYSGSKWLRTNTVLYNYYFRMIHKDIQVCLSHN
jgi:hypothetical protein